MRRFCYFEKLCCVININVASKLSIVSENS